MSRIGKKAITLPDKVKVKLDGQKISVDGPKGSLSRILPSLICCTFNEGQKELVMGTTQETNLSRAIYGLSRTLVANMVIGVSKGFEKKLQITGVGYRAQLDGKNLVLNMGYSHPVKMITPQELSVKVENPTTVVISGMEKELVGEFAAKIRSVRPPEPYKGKGIAYAGEIIRRKAGKTGK
jgi:large subunit ribosomal protein L6|uniref:Large ribosomal subunit protein uL6c n=2 Tax=Chrysochromulina TaxID=35140 RepID=A0A075DWS7_9EUKA|nr:50S ribosomal protein L6 [Chrysochromulina parva]AHY04335.1 50S ribosomal protein L6 [Chrysochromulina tobinii]AUS84362.1 50S ribosomal protein L6 [Chrysochromulina parva]